MMGFFPFSFVLGNETTEKRYFLEMLSLKCVLLNSSDDGVRSHFGRGLPYSLLLINLRAEMSLEKLKLKWRNGNFPDLTYLFF